MLLVFRALVERGRDQRHVDVEPSPYSGRGLNADLAVKKLDALAHAQQAETRKSCRVRIESSTLVGDDELERAVPGP